MQILSGVRYGSEIAAAARSHGLDPKLLAAVAAQETGGPGESSGNNVVGDGGHGHGLFQIDDRSWAFARTPAAMDPAENADLAASILESDLQRYGGNVREALCAYNTGSPTATGTPTLWGDGKTLGYADSVLRHYAELSGGTALDAGSAPAATAYAPNGNSVMQAPDGTAAASAQDGLAGELSSELAGGALDGIPAPTTPTQTAWRSWASLGGDGQNAAGVDQLVAASVDPSALDDTDA